ncbi:MAG TPA: S-4TM family putative pore-forming effector [Ignavibacteriaceae bacterium]|nr:S-4TM family putative pore-forming effector [Ignavibacteriaceae bacterium]
MINFQVMTNFGAHIVQEQNTDANIKYLASQKKIYNTGKLTFTIQVLIAVPIPIIISIIVPLLKNIENNITWTFILYSILATFLELFLEGKTCELKKRAASIQELFDSKVLLINWNSILIPKQPESEVIFRYYNKFVKKYTLDKLYDWYPKEIESVKTNVATLLGKVLNYL